MLPSCSNGAGADRYQKLVECVENPKSQVRPENEKTVLGGSIRIGFHMGEVFCAWGAPDKIDKSITQEGTRETWWYGWGDPREKLKMLNFDVGGYLYYIGS